MQESDLSILRDLVDAGSEEAALRLVESGRDQGDDCGGSEHSSA